MIKRILTTALPWIIIAAIVFGAIMLVSSTLGTRRHQEEKPAVVNPTPAPTPAPAIVTVPDQAVQPVTVPTGASHTGVIDHSENLVFHGAPDHSTPAKARWIPFDGYLVPLFKNNQGYDSPARADKAPPTFLLPKAPASAWKVVDVRLANPRGQGFVTLKGWGIVDPGRK